MCHSPSTSLCSASRGAFWHGLCATLLRTALLCTLWNNQCVLFTLWSTTTSRVISSCATLPSSSSRRLSFHHVRISPVPNSLRSHHCAHFLTCCGVVHDLPLCCRCKALTVQLCSLLPSHLKGDDLVRNVLKKCARSQVQESNYIVSSLPQCCLFFVALHRLYISLDAHNANLASSPNPAEILIDDLCHWTSSPGACLVLQTLFAYFQSYYMGKLEDEVWCCAFLQLLGS